MGQRKRSRDEWNCDHCLRSAFRVLHINIRLAARVQKRMKSLLDTMHYGNTNIGDEIDKLWLRGRLRITCFEQIDFLPNFKQKHCPVSSGLWAL